MVKAYHEYVSRCQFLLQQGKAVADILFLIPEGAPNIFTPPESALSGTSTMPDRKGYNFDGCWPSQLNQAEVQDGSIVFPKGSRYEVLVLPSGDYITEELLKKIIQLTSEGATIVGNPRVKSHGLTGYPQSDNKIHEIAEKFWGSTLIPEKLQKRTFGKGTIYWGEDLESGKDQTLYPSYELISSLLLEKGVEEDFLCSDEIRYTHRRDAGYDIYFVANTRDNQIQTEVSFRTSRGQPELWDPVTGTKRALPDFKKLNDRTVIPLHFFPNESYFIVFSELAESAESGSNFLESMTHQTIEGPWEVSFDSVFGGPKQIQFPELIDWSSHKEEGIKYYSGIASYTNTFKWEGSSEEKDQYFLHLGEVNHMAKVFLNEIEVGTVWTAPWRQDVTSYLQEGENQLEIRVANLWANRLIGDADKMEDGRIDGKWAPWLNDGSGPKNTFSFITRKYYSKEDQLLKSGLIGPVIIQSINQN